MAKVIFSLLFFASLGFAKAPLLVIQQESNEFNHQTSIAIEAADGEITISNNSNWLFMNEEKVRFGIWKIPASVLSKNSLLLIQEFGRDGAEQKSAGPAHTIETWIEAKRIHLEKGKRELLVKILREALYSPLAKLERGFVFDKAQKKITEQKNESIPEIQCQAAEKTCVFPGLAFLFLY